MSKKEKEKKNKYVKRNIDISDKIDEGKKKTDDMALYQREYQRKYREKNREKVREYQREYMREYQRKNKNKKKKNSKQES